MYIQIFLYIAIGTIRYQYINLDKIHFSFISIYNTDLWNELNKARLLNFILNVIILKFKNTLNTILELENLK